MSPSKPPRRHLRRTLALEFLLIAGAIHLVLIVVIIGVRESQLRQQFDADLLRRAERIAGAAEQDLLPAAAVPHAAAGETLSGAMTPLLAQSRSLTGEVLSASLPLSGSVIPLPFDLQEGTIHRGPYYQTIDGDLFGRSGETFRVVTLYEEGPPPYYLQAAASNQAIAASIASLRQLLFVLALPGAVLGAGISAWLLSGHMVRRIEEVSRAVQRIGSPLPGAKLDVRAGSDEIGGMVVEMNSMLSRLEGAFRAQERFIVDVTHELKTPVSVMLAEAQVLKKSRGASVDRYRQFVESVEEEMRRLGSLLESFLTLARSGHGARYISESLVDLTDAALSAIQRCDGIAREHNVSVEFVLPSDEDTESVAVRGDQELLTTLLANLIRNAVESSAAAGRVEVVVSVADGQAKVGVSSKVSPDAVLEAGQRGRELAFTVARGIAELHGGEIHTSSQDGRQLSSLEIPIIRAA
jgi:signal transduction histidine kinase